MTADIIKWHKDNGGFKGNLAAHALRLLGETLELAIAAGASEDDILDLTATEMTKAAVRHEWGGNPDDIPQEFADVSFLQELFSHYAGIDVPQARKDKFKILEEREWSPDVFGVLWRPGTKGKLEETH